LKEGIVELHAIVHGRVQGVSFRAITTEFASEIGLKGTVANLPDGTVEIYAQGTQGQLKNLIELLQGPSGPGIISRIDQEYKKPSNQFEGFKIVRG
jgi:acylphosphatase